MKFKAYKHKETEEISVHPENVDPDNNWEFIREDEFTNLAQAKIFYNKI